MPQHRRDQSCFHKLWSNPQQLHPGDEQGKSRFPSSLLFKPLVQSSRRLLSDFTHSLSHSSSPGGKIDLWSSTGAEAEEPLPTPLPSPSHQEHQETGAGVRRAGRAHRKSLQIRWRLKSRLERSVIPSWRGVGEDSRLESSP